MIKKEKVKKMILGYRLDVLNTHGGPDKWLSPKYSFGNRYAAELYRQKHYADAKKFRIYAVRVVANDVSAILVNGKNQ